MRIILITFLLFSCTQTWSQSPKQWMRYGDKAVEEHDHYGAAVYYQRAYKLDTMRIDILYKCAEAVRTYHDYDLAATLYQEVLERDQDELFPESRFWLAGMLKCNSDYEEAENQYEAFINTYRNRSSYFYRKAKHEILSCQFAQKLIKDTVETTIFNAGNELNTYDSEFGAIQINDSTLYYSALRPVDISEDKQVKDKRYFVRIYSAALNDSMWKTEMLIDSAINMPDYHIANASLSRDGKRMYFSKCDEKKQCAIYVSYRNEKSTWKEPVMLNERVNLPGYTSTQPMPAVADGKDVLFFASDRPGGKGRMDIWYCEVTGEEYGLPKNLGSKVNSMDDEVSPFYDSKNDVLYFSSTWHYGLGGFDIFKSEGGLRPKEPVNMGFPVNSSVNDFYYSIDTTGTLGFLTSNRIGSYTKKGETCCNDIYVLKFPVEKSDPDSVIPPEGLPPVPDTLALLPDTPAEVNTNAAVNPPEGLPPITDNLPLLPGDAPFKGEKPLTLYFHNDEPDPRSWNKQTPLSYNQTFDSYWDLQDTYRLEFAEGFTGAEKDSAVHLIGNFFNEKVKKGYDDLYPFQQYLLRELQAGKDVELIIKGYASPLARSDYNVNLSLRRISSFINYLKAVDNGIFLPYIDESDEEKAKLTFIKNPFGEYKSASDVSDDLYDLRNSVYSKKAALERKIEIEIKK